MKGAWKRILTSLLLIFFLCSFSFNVYAAGKANSDFYEDGLYDYEDSFIGPGSDQNKQLFFVPLIPPSNYKHYTMIYYPTDKSFYLYLHNKYHPEIYYDFVLFVEGYELYKWNPDKSATWELLAHYNYGDPAQWEIKYPGGLVVVDGTYQILGYQDSSLTPSYYRMHHYTGYRLYWWLALIEKMILQKLVDFSELIMNTPLLRFAFVTFFAGEVVIFAVVLIQRIGRLKHEEG